MTTKAQRKQRRIAEQRGKQFALERAVLNAARALQGALVKHRFPEDIPDTTWLRFSKAEEALHEYHAERQRAADKGCKHANLPVKYDAADCAGKDEHYVRKHYPRFSGNCPDCGVQIIGYASQEHYYAGDW